MFVHPLLQRWLLLGLVTALAVLAVALILNGLQKLLVNSEAHLLHFTSVRDADCFSDDDRRKIKAEIAGKEDEA